MKTACLLVLLATPSLVIAQSPPDSSSAPIATATGAFFAVSVADLDASTKWYGDKLGLRPVMRGDRMGRVSGVVVLEGGGLIVELVRHEDAVPPPAGGAELVRGFFKSGAVVADFERITAKLRARGVEIVIGPFPARPTARANLIFRDNAGNLIQLFGDYARE